MRALPIIVILVGIGSACDTVAPPAFEETVVVEAHLVAGEPLSQIRLSWTAPLDGTFNFDSLSISGADVVVHRVAPDGRTDAVFRYVDPQSHGIYNALDPEDVVPGAHYRLIADVEGHAMQITAETVVPDELELRSASADTVVYQVDQLALRVNATSTSGRPLAFIMTTEALDPSLENLTPVYRNVVDNGPSEPADFRVSSSPLFSEAAESGDPEGEVEIILPWLAVPFYGPMIVRLHVLDDNLYDFIRTQAVQQGGGTLPPGEIPNVIDHVDGGTGVFGSMARVTHEMVVLRPEEAFQLDV